MKEMSKKKTWLDKLFIAIVVPLGWVFIVILIAADIVKFLYRRISRFFGSGPTGQESKGAAD